MKILYENIEKGKLKLPKYLSNDARKIIAKMLSRDPKKRPTLPQLMKDPFFADIDWDLLEAKLIKPPQILCKSDPKKQDLEKSKKRKEEEMLFESDGDEERGYS